MRLPLPFGVERLLIQAKNYKLAFVLLIVGVLWAGLWWRGATVTPQVTREPKVAAVPELPVQRTVQKSDWATIQEKQEQDRRNQATLHQELRDLKLALVQAERDRKVADEQSRQQWEARLRQALEAQASKLAHQHETARQAAEAAAHTRASKPKAPPSQAAAATATVSRGTMEIHRNDAKEWTAGAAALPDTTRDATAYLPAGSYAHTRLVTGVFASARRGGALPVLLSVTRPFHGPYQLHGPGRRPEPTGIPIEGCLMLGKAEADLSSSRANMTLDLLSCVFPDKAAYEKPLKGYVVGPDGTLGLPCTLETRDTAYLARTFLVSLMSGAAEAMALAKRTVIVTPFGGTTTTTNSDAIGATAGFSALSRATADLSKFYLEQAERLMPVLWCEADTNAQVVLQEGVSLEGFPTHVTLSRGGS